MVHQLKISSQPAIMKKEILKVAFLFSCRSEFVTQERTLWPMSLEYVNDCDLCKNKYQAVQETANKFPIQMKLAIKGVGS